MTRAKSIVCHRHWNAIRSRGYFGEEREMKESAGNTEDEDDEVKCGLPFTD